MGRLGVTYIDVEGAITKLQGQNRASTVDNIREVLGTGSKSTIARLLREWKAQRGLSFSDTAILPNDLLTIVKELWSRVQGKAEQEIREYQQDSDTKLINVEQELNRYKAMEKQWQVKHHELEEKYHQQIAQNKELNNEFTAEQQGNAKLTSSVESLQAAKDEANKENDRLHQLLQHMQQNLEHYQAAAQKLREEQTILFEKQRTEYEQRIVALQNRLEENIQDKLYYQAQYEQLQKSYESVDSKYQNMTEQYQALQQQHNILEVTYDSLKGENNRLQDDWQQKIQELNEKKTALTELQFNVKVANDKLALLEENLSSAEDKITILSDDLLFALQEKANLEGQLKKAYLEKPYGQRESQYES